MSSTKEILKSLFVDGSDDKVLFEQYKLYVEMANDVSNRRDKTNKFYVTVISLLITVFSIIISLTNEFVIFFIPLFSIILISLVWMKNIESYSTLNRAKFDVINEIETRLSVKGFTIECGLLKLYQYGELTRVEKNVPKSLIAISVIVMVLLIFFKIIGYIF